MTRQVKPTPLTAIIAVLLLHFEKGLQHNFLSSYSLETLFNCIHKIQLRESLNENTFKALRLLTFLNVARFLNLNALSSSELYFKVKTASNRRNVNKHLEKMFRSAANRPQ